MYSPQQATDATTSRRFWPVALMACLALLAPEIATAGLTLKWEWRGATAYPSHPDGDPNVAVAQMTDDNGDGVIDCRDTPDLIFTSSIQQDEFPFRWHSVIHVVDGATGVTHRTIGAGESGVTDEFPRDAFAIADINRDRTPEIVTSTLGYKQLQAYWPDGTLLWTSDLAVESTFGDTSGIGFADFDHDGSTEIYVNGAVFSATGALMRDDWKTACLAADLIPGGNMELLCGVKAVDPITGTVIWEREDLKRGLPTAGDFLAGDSLLEVMLARSAPRGDSFADLHLLNGQTGESIGVPFLFDHPTDQKPSWPAAGELDGDASDAEVFVAARNGSRIFDATPGGPVNVTPGGLYPTLDSTTRVAGTTFDVTGDGIDDVIYQDSRDILVLDPTTADPYAEVPEHSCTGQEHPFVADIDGDGAGELIASGCEENGGRDAFVLVFEFSAPRPSPTIWNQYTYNGRNIREDGRVPLFEAPPGPGAHHWNGQPPGPAAGASISCDAGPDLLMPCGATPVRLDADYTPCTANLSWTTDCPGGSFDDPTRPDPLFDMEVPPCGTCSVTLTVQDGAEQCVDTVTIEHGDSQPPEVTPSVEGGLEICLWPPNHRYVEVTDLSALYSATDSCGVASVSYECRSDQCDDAPPDPDSPAPDCMPAEHVGENGDGVTVDDCHYDPETGTLHVRSERAGTEEEGRTYTVEAIVQDACGNEAREVVLEVWVPHDQDDPQARQCLSPNHDSPVSASSL